MKEIIKVKNEIIKALVTGLISYEEAQEYCAKMGITL